MKTIRRCLLLTLTGILMLTGVAHAGDTAWRTDGYLFLDARNVEVDGSAMQAIIVAYPRFANEHVDLAEQALRCCIIQSLKAENNSYIVRFTRLAGSDVWNDVHYDYHIVQKEIGAPPQPPNSQPIAKFQPSASLLGSDVMAFMAGYAVWTDYQKKKKLDLGGTAAQAVSIHQFAYFDHLVYGIGFTHKWYVTNTLGCDYNVRIEPETYKQNGEISVIC